MKRNWWIIKSEPKLTRSNSDYTSLPPSQQGQGRKEKLFNKSQPPVVPDIPVRDGYKSFNVNLIEALIQGYSDLKISINDLLEYSVLLANKVFGQSWKIGSNTEDESENNNVGEDVTENPDKIEGKG